MSTNSVFYLLDELNYIRNAKFQYTFHSFSANEEHAHSNLQWKIVHLAFYACTFTRCTHNRLPLRLRSSDQSFSHIFSWDLEDIKIRWAFVLFPIISLTGLTRQRLNKKKTRWMLSSLDPQSNLILACHRAEDVTINDDWKKNTNVGFWNVHKYFTDSLIGFGKAPEFLLVEYKLGFLVLVWHAVLLHRPWVVSSVGVFWSALYYVLIRIESISAL